MSIINAMSYEISIWQDDIKSKGAEKRLFVIGSDQLMSKNRALEPVLTKNINGSLSLSFKMYYSYIDENTGKEQDNPFIDWLVNERKIKLKTTDANGKVKWYDFILKNRKKDSVNKQYIYTAKDASVEELSKAGFSFSFSDAEKNNMGTITELALKALEGTEWKVTKSSFEQQHIIDSTVYFTMADNVNCYEILETPSETRFTLTKKVVPVGTRCKAPKTCCSDNELIFQFTNTINNKKYWLQTYNLDKASFNFPFRVTEIKEAPGEKYKKWICRPFGHKDTLINQYVYDYINVDNPNKIISGYTKKHYYAPELIESLTPSGQEFQIADNIAGWDKKGTTGNGSLEVINKSVSIENGLLKINQVAGPNLLHIRNCSAVCSDLQHNRKKILPLYNGDRYVCRVKIEDSDLSKVAFNFNIGSKQLFNEVSDWIQELDKEKPTGWYYKIYQYKLDDIASLDKEISINITPISSTDFYLESLQFFKFIPSKTSSAVPMLPVDSIDSGYTRTEYYYYDSTLPENSVAYALGSPEQLQYLSISEGPLKDYMLKLHDNCDKVSSIQISESNYYNIITALCEKFECYADFLIEHSSNGDIISKAVSFRKYDDAPVNPVGFKYNINLNGITRTDISDKLVSKLIVKTNSNSFAKNGYCSIANASSNLSHDNVIYNFDYYYDMNLLDQAKTEQLYNEYLDQLIPINIQIELLNRESSGLVQSLRKVRHDKEINDLKIEELKKTITRNEKDLKDLTGCSLTDFESGVMRISDEDWKRGPNKNYWYISNTDQDGLDLDSNFYHDVTGHYLTGPYSAWCYNEGSWIKNKGLANQEIYVQGSILTDFPKFLLSLWKDETIGKETYALVQSIQDLKKQLKDCEQATYSKDFLYLKKKYDKIVFDLKEARQTKINCQNTFQNQLRPFIKEGTWIKEEYVDEELYYKDALQVLKDSCYPKLNYDIKVTAISGSEKYKDYNYSVGQITYIEDEDYFKNGHREKVYIVEIVSNLDAPEKDTIRVQNYKQKNDELFKRITATVQGLNYQKGTYEKGGQAVQNSSVKGEFLTEAFQNNNNLLKNLSDQTVTWGKEGIQIEGNNSLDLLRLTNGGLLLSKDKGDTWTTGVTSNGINASLITAGSIDTGKVQIMNGNMPAFKWDAKGINAYAYGNGSVDTTKGVCLNQFGLYGYNGAVPGWYPTDSNAIMANENTSFALTWDGFKFATDDGGVHIDNENAVNVYRDKDHEKEGIPSVTLGKYSIEKDGSDKKYGLIIRDSIGEPRFYCDDNGNVVITDYLTDQAFQEKTAEMTQSTNKSIQDAKNELKGIIDTVDTKIDSAAQGLQSSIDTSDKNFKDALAQQEVYNKDSIEKYNQATADFTAQVSSLVTKQAEFTQTNKDNAAAYEKSLVEYQAAREEIDAALASKTTIDGVQNFLNPAQNSCISIEIGEKNKSNGSIQIYADAERQSRWYWDYNGLSFQKKGADGNYAIVTTGIDKEGHIYASDIKAEAIKGKTIESATLKSCSIFAGDNNEFVVTSDGKVSATELNISGGSIFLGKENSLFFSVDKNGTVSANSLNITGGQIALGDDGTNVQFSVDSQGAVIARKLSIIGNNSSISMGENGSGFNFYVSNQGEVIAKKLDISGGSILLEDPSGTTRFSVTNKGKVVASDITINGGRISLGSSEVGKSFFSVDENGKVSANSLNITGGQIALGKNKQDETKVQFLVDNTGKAIANDLHINGGRISLGDNLIIDQNQVFFQTADKRSLFLFNNNGLTLSGPIQWTNGASPAQALYSSIQTKPDRPYNQYEDSSSSTWHKIYNKNEDKFVSNTFDGGQTWTEAIPIGKGERGPQGPTGKDGNSIIPLYAGSDTYLAPIDEKEWFTNYQDVLDSQPKYIWIKNKSIDAAGNISYSIPTLYEAYQENGSKMSTSYAQFLRLTDGLSETGIYPLGNGELAINADFINAGTLTVGDRRNLIFSADISSKKVSLAGWEATDTFLCANRENSTKEDAKMVGMYSGDNYKIKSLVNSDLNVTSKPRFFAGTYVDGGTPQLSSSRFLVLEDGSLFASAAKIEGNISASAGKIGPFEVAKDQIFIDSEYGDGTIPTYLNLKTVSKQKPDAVDSFQETYINKVGPSVIMMGKSRSDWPNDTTIQMGDTSYGEGICYGYFNGAVALHQTFIKDYKGQMIVGSCNEPGAGEYGGFILSSSANFGVLDGDYNDAPNTPSINGSKYHLGLKGQLKVEVPGVGPRYLRIDQGIITGIDKKSYSGYKELAT